MALSVTIRSGEISPEPVVFDQPRVVLGRGAGSDIILPDPSVTSRHASIRQRGSEYIILDEGSTNGTFVGPVRLASGAPRVLRTGELIRLGRIWLEISVEPAAPTPNPALLTRELALKLIGGALEQEGPGRGLPEVRVTSGPDTGARLYLSEFNRPYTIGRIKKCELQLTDEDTSRRHLEVLRRGLHFHVRELASKNGARMQRPGMEPVALESNVEQTWEPGASVLLGRSRLELTDAVGVTFGALGAAADEVVEDTVDPPTSLPAESPAEAAGSDAQPEATHADPPRKASVGASLGRRSRWTLADLAVALAALVILGGSLVGLSWLLTE